jgi:polysaccharide export outer membrane protein
MVHGRTAPVWISALLAALIVSGCTSLPFASKPRPTPPPQPASDQGYGLQPGDVIRVSVWREEALDQGVLVRPDGAISFPLAGDITVEGETVEEVTSAIADKLSEFIPNPVVTVSLHENLGNRIYVTGRVNQPGVFLLNRPVDIMQALAIAGGLNPFADKDGIRVLRRQGDRQITIPFDYKQVRKGLELQQNILLQPGDTLIVP